MSHPLSKEFIQKLIKKEEVKTVATKPVFMSDELKLIKKTLRERGTSLTLKGRSYRIRYFMAKDPHDKKKKVEWVTVRPLLGFVPMFSYPYNDVLRAEDI